jgi:hypothetical protein
MGGVARRELADQHEIGPGGLELLTSTVQLDRVGLAINSAVMAEPNERGGALAPEVSQADLVTFLVGQHDFGEGVCVHLPKPTTGYSGR